jgi:hypothetical protein
MSTPVAGIATQTSAVAGQPINAISPNVSGGFIVNPLDPKDQGLANAEPLFVSQAGPATTTANDTTLALQPGQSYSVVPGTTTGVSVASLSASHKFTSVQWT